ncbi:uncharacterized protein LOC135308416 [Passer domesticus]|uniref:uncharacterized protein LOC135308416 n=1 Tax=Passer domesticus TaxID=48849 RepID=UPI0030FEAC19
MITQTRSILPPVAIAIIAFWCATLPTSQPWVVPQPKRNVWKTLASALGQDSICLTTASATDPLSTCLVGIPISPDELPDTLYPSLEPLFNNKINCPSNLYPNVAWRKFSNRLNQSKSEPTEFTLLGSSTAHFCFQFFPFPGQDEKSYTPIISSNHTAGNWCSSLSQITIPITLNDKPKSLPNGLFLICGNRAWQGIPSRLLGGPCTIGRLTLFTPSKDQIVNWPKIKVTPNSNRTKRDLKNLDNTCDEEIVHWGKPEEVAWITFLPWVAVAQALGELGHLECWVAKQANLTSTVLSDLLEDEEITRQATLQNRAAIDFLLLLHDHKCDEFEGLCCLNLSSKAEDVRISISKMKDMINQIKEESADWLGNLFTGWGLSGWVSSVLKTVVLILFILLLISVTVCIVWNVLKGLLLKLTSPVEINRVVAREEDELYEEDFEIPQDADYPGWNSFSEDSF